MADFNVAIRSSYRDVARLALDLRPGDWERSADTRVVKWRNKAPPRYGSTPRFGDAAWSTHAQRPFTDGDRAVFRAALSTRLVVPLVGTFGAASQNWTFAFEYAPGDRTAKQAVLCTGGAAFAVWRIGSDGNNYGYQTSAGEVLTADGEMDAAAYMLAFEGGGLADLLRDNSERVSGGASANITFPDGASSLLIGHSGAGDYLDGSLRSVRVWNRELSPKERDFCFQSLSGTDTSAGVSPDPRAVVDIRAWTDGTGDLSLRQARRVNPTAGRHQKFRRAVSGAAAVVQLACETSGDVLEDSALGGDLYTMSSIERASPAEPTVSQDAGWSSVFDVRIPASGHYTFKLERTNHGAVYVHLDAVVG